MKFLILLFYTFSTLIKLLRPGGLKAVVAENTLLKQQFIVVNRKYKRAPNLRVSDRLIFGFLTSFTPDHRLNKVSVILKPSALLKFHKALCTLKYHLLFSQKTRGGPGPKGPSWEIIDVIIEMKQRNPRYDYRKISMQVSNSFGVDIDKNVVRLVLAKYYKPKGNGQGPFWLTFIGHMKDSLWSLDLFRCESILLKTHWIVVIMDQFSRRIIGFAVHAENLNSIAVCCLFNKIIFQKALPKYLSSDNDLLFNYFQWQANLRILDVKEIKLSSRNPRAHLFIERLIGTVRREFLEHILFWNAHDLENKLKDVQSYFNNSRCHWSIDGKTPLQQINNNSKNILDLSAYTWGKTCRGLYQLPVAA